MIVGDTSPRRVAIIGAGAAGIVAARTLRDAGNAVDLFEREAEIGGVWSATRAYPGLRTQNDKRSYAFSDEPMPGDWPEYPTGEQMRRYLEGYTDRHAIRPLLRLRHDVRSAVPDGAGWLLEVAGPDGVRQIRFDAVVVANGIFSSPRQLPAGDAFRRAGGVIASPGEAFDAATGKRVVVVGWGKTACDLAVGVVGRADSVDVVARSILWKMPDRLGSLRPHRLLMLTRTGEYLLYDTATTPLAWLLRRVTMPARRLVLGALQTAVVRRYRLDALGLVPEGHLSNINSRITEGLYEAVESGRLQVHRDVSVVELVDAPVRGVRLSDGRVLQADVVVPAIGYQPRLDFLPDQVVRDLQNETGSLQLHRAVLGRPAGLYFVGWTQSLSGFIAAEVAAMWVAAHLAGELDEPDGVYPHDGMRPVAPLPISVPGDTLTELDVLMQDLPASIGRRTRLLQWLRPVAAADYRRALDEVRDRLRRSV